MKVKIDQSSQLNSDFLATLRTTLLLFCILISTLFAGSATADAQELFSEPEILLNQIHRLYTDRFDQNGRYLNDSAKKENFKRRQLEAIQQLKSKGLIGDSFVINNTAKADLSIRVSIVKDHSQEVHGLLIERSQYDSTTEAFLRLFNKTVLEGGMDLLRFPEGSVVHIQKGSSSAAPWSVVIRYPRDFKAQDFAATTVRIVQSSIAGRHAILNEQNVSFSRITLDLWYKIFGGNFGISGLKFD